MSFWLYRIKEEASRASFERVSEVRLTGSAGPLARFLQGNAAEETPFAWSLTAKDLIPYLISDTEDSGNYVLVMDLSAESLTQAELQLFERVHGVSEYDSTDLVLVFRSLFVGSTPVVASEFKQSFSVELPLDKREMVEALSLTGGTTKGRYFWSPPKMNIGAAICPSR